MSILDDIKDDLTDLQTLQMIAASFTDTAAMRIRGIREAFETNQQFYEELSHVYHLVKLCAIKQGIIPDKPPSAKTLLVAFTANQHFYGNIHRRIMEYVLKEHQQSEYDLLVIGTTGKEYLTVSGQEEKFRLLHFEKDDPTDEEISHFLHEVSSYTSVRVYYPHFMSLMRQEVGMIDITQVQEMIGQATEEAETYILFEPEVDKIIDFFERQIRGVLFRRVVLEADLSRTAARMVSMNEASDRALEMMKEKHAEYLKVMRSFINRQLLDTFSGMSLWKDA